MRRLTKAEVTDNVESHNVIKYAHATLRYEAGRVSNLSTVWIMQLNQIELAQTVTFFGDLDDVQNLMFKQSTRGEA